MAFVVGDDSGLCKELSWVSEQTRRTRIIKSNKQNRSLAATALCWSGAPGYELPSATAPALKDISSRLGSAAAGRGSIGRACGLVEAFATSGIVCENPASSFSTEDGALDKPLRSFWLPSTPVALSPIGSGTARAYTRSLLCSEWLTNGITPVVALLREALQPPAAFSEADGPHSLISNTSLLLAVGQKGHTCVVEWQGSFGARILDEAHAMDEQEVASAGLPETQKLVDVTVNFKPIVKERSAGTWLVEEASADAAFNCLAAYLLPGPVAAATIHPVCHSLLAFGGRDNDAKVVDLEYGSLFWAAKNVKPSFLGLQSQIAVTQMEWLLPVHPMVLSVGSARGVLRFYDLRCQRRPILEVCEATQEKRPVTALCVRPTAEVLRTQTDMRIALAKAAEDVASDCYLKPTPHPAVTGSTKRVRSKPVGKEATEHSPSDRSGNTSERAVQAKTLLTSCSGKDSAVVYYADSHGMVYGLRVVGGAALLRLADKNCPKFNPSSYRSLGDQPKAEHSAEGRRKLIFAMLEKQRQRLSSSKNDHPMATAACADLQLAALPVGGYKGIMGAVLGLSLDPTGEFLIAVGLGRHAYLFEAKSRKLCYQAFLKQKLTCVLATGGEKAGGSRRRTDQQQQPDNSEIRNEGTTCASGNEVCSDSDHVVDESDSTDDDGSQTENDRSSGAASAGSCKFGASSPEFQKSKRPYSSSRVKRKITSREKVPHRKTRT